MDAGAAVPRRGRRTETVRRAVISALIALTEHTVDASAFPRNRSPELAGGAANCQQICVPPVGNCKNHSPHRERACSPCITSTTHTTVHLNRYTCIRHLYLLPFAVYKYWNESSALAKNDMFWLLRYYRFQVSILF